MGVSMNSRTSGFRKWADAHDPRIAGAPSVADDSAVISATDPDQPVTAPEEQPHHPWLVPGAGRL
jgi:hypothetical protein